MSSRHRSFANFHDTGWRTGVFRALLIAVLAASAVAAPAAILRGLTPWRMGYLLPLAFLAALIGVFDTVRLGRPDWRDRRGLLFRLGEVVLMLMLAQIVIWFAATGLPSTVEVGVWLRHPGTFLTGQSVATGLLVLGAWGLAVQASRDFLDLAIQPDEVAAREQPCVGRYPQPVAGVSSPWARRDRGAVCATLGLGRCCPGHNGGFVRAFSDTRCRGHPAVQFLPIAHAAGCGGRAAVLLSSWPAAAQRRAARCAARAVVQ